MKDFFRHIIIVLTASMALLSLHSCKEDGIIDEHSMAKIYAEMLVTDQWINSTPGMRMIADTSLVYEPILKKYGYTSEDYRKSVDHYLNDPDTYADIMKMTVRILDGQLVDLHKKKNELEEDKKRAQFVRKMARDIKLNDSVFAITHIHEAGFGPDDSLSVEWDTLSLCFNFVRVPKKVHADTLCVSDSITVAVADTLATTDSMEVQHHDTLKTFVSLKNASQLKVSDTLFKKKRLL